MKKLLLLIAVSFVFISTQVLTDNSKTDFDKNFFAVFKKTDIIARDSLLNSYLNKTISGKGIVKSISKTARYNCGFRAEVEDAAAKNQKLYIRYNLYMKNEASFEGLVSGEAIDFTGQMILLTPLNSVRTQYIVDVLLSSAVLVID